ncbi:MAG: hypothetical protein AABM64_04180 [Pseudomonadota bacterium]
MPGVSVAASLFQFRSRATTGFDLAAQPAPLNSEADGELIGATPIRFSLLPRYVKVVVP